jgi:hypothetical protein
LLRLEVHLISSEDGAGGGLEHEEALISYAKGVLMLMNHAPCVLQRGAQGSRQNVMYDLQ